MQSLSHLCLISFLTSSGISGQRYMAVSRRSLLVDQAHEVANVFALCQYARGCRMCNEALARFFEHSMVNNGKSDQPTKIVLVKATPICHFGVRDFFSYGKLGSDLETVDCLQARRVSRRPLSMTFSTDPHSARARACTHIWTQKTKVSREQLLKLSRMVNDFFACFLNFWWSTT